MVTADAQRVSLGRPMRLFPPVRYGCRVSLRPEVLPRPPPKCRTAPPSRRRTGIAASPISGPPGERRRGTPADGDRGAQRATPVGSRPAAPAPPLVAGLRRETGGNGRNRRKNEGGRPNRPNDR